MDKFVYVKWSWLRFWLGVMVWGDNLNLYFQLQKTVFIQKLTISLYIMVTETYEANTQIKK